MADVKMKPCPFCGGEAKMSHYSSAVCGEIWRVVCDKPFCAQGPDRYAEAEAIAAWNNRAPYEDDDWFYLPKPKEAVVQFGSPQIEKTENGYEAEQPIEIIGSAIHAWGDELGNYLVKRICEVWSETCEHVNGSYPRCPHCGARVKERE